MTTTENGVIKPKKPVEIPMLMKGGMIDLEHVEPIDFIVDDMLSPGLSMLAADPKIENHGFHCSCVYACRKDESFLDIIRINVMSCT